MAPYVIEEGSAIGASGPALPPLLPALPLWFQNRIGYTAFQTGLSCWPWRPAASSPAASARSSADVAARSSSSVSVSSFEIIGVAGLGLLLRPDSTWLTATPLLFIYGIGVRFATAQLTGVVLADVPIQRNGQGSGTPSAGHSLVA
jgi:hypothetical protein